MTDDIKISQEAIHLLAQLRENLENVTRSKQTLSVSVKLIEDNCVELHSKSSHRNVLLGLPANHNQPPTIEQVLMDHFKAFPDNIVILNSQKNLTASFSHYLLCESKAKKIVKDKHKNRTNENDLMKQMMNFSSFGEIVNQFETLRHYKICSSVLKALFAAELKKHDIQAITFLELKRRLGCLDRKMQLSKSKGPTSKMALEWRQNLPDESKKLHFRRSAVLMEADIAWTSEFENIFSSRHVDELAELCLPGRLYDGKEEQEAGDNRPVAKGHELRTKDGKLMGTVFDIKNPLSPQARAWLERTTKDEKYFEDATRQEGRLRRVGSLLVECGEDQSGFVVFGNPPNAYGYLTVAASAVDLFIMQIGHYVRQRHSEFVMQYIKNKYGSTTLSSVFPVPLDPIDTIIAQASNQGNNSTDLGRHSDLKAGLHRKGNGPGGPWDLTTPTLCLQNHSLECTSIKWMLKDGRNKGHVLGKIICGKTSFHYQGFGVQVGCEHEVSTDSSEIGGTGADYVRQVYSCRSIAPNFDLVMDQLEEGRQNDLVLHGSADMYTRTIKNLNSILLEEQTAACIKDKDVDDHLPVGKEQEVLMAVKKKKRHMQCKNAARPKQSKLSNPLPINLKTLNLRSLWKWKVTKRITIYVLSGLKLAVLPGTCFQWCASLSAYSRMIKKKILLRKMSIPVGGCVKAKKGQVTNRSISYPHPRVERDFYEWDDKLDRPLQLGTMRLTTAVAQKYGIQGSDSNWSTWPAKTDLLNAVLLREPEKNQLSMPLDRRSFSLDLDHILNGRKREGAWLGGSGGGMNTNGQLPPAGIGNNFLGTFEKAQEVTDEKNKVIIQQAGRRTLVNLFVTENMHPDTLRGGIEKPSKERCYYLGVYQLGDVLITADTEDELQALVEEYQSNSSIDGYLLRFRGKPHIRIQCNPVDMPKIDVLSEWTMLEVAVDDPRRLVYVLPENANVSGKFDLKKEGNVTLGAVYDRLVNDDQLIEGLRKPVFQSSQKEDNSLLLTSQTKRVYDLLRFMDILCKMSAGVFLRLLEVNVDKDGSIGPLVPPNDVDDLGLPEYTRLFGQDARYAEYLGLEVQRSPSPHPMRSYDANRLWLIQEFGPGRLRDSRIGMKYIKDNRDKAKRMLISSFICETIGNPCILQDWSHRLEKNSLLIGKEEEMEPGEEFEDNPEIKDKEVVERRKRIPGDKEEVASFLAFIEAAVQEKGQESFSALLNGYYKLPQLFRSYISFRNTVQHWTKCGADELLDFIIGINQECREGKFKEEKQRERIKVKMMDILLDSGSVTNSTLLEFFVWHLMADMDELISGYPFGKAELATTSFGSELGMKRLERSFKNGGIMKLGQEIVAIWLQQSDDELSMMGLYKKKNHLLYVKINDRQVSLPDVEHWLCKLYWFSERDIGGTRSFSMNPSVAEPHLHPCVDIVWGPDVQKILNDVVESMKRVVEKNCNIAPP